jgi:hypothetical protein
MQAVWQGRNWVLAQGLDQQSSHQTLGDLAAHSIGRANRANA